MVHRGEGKKVVDTINAVGAWIFLIALVAGFYLIVWWITRSD